MDTLIRSIVIFIFILIIFRLSGKRSLKDVTVFDFVMLLIISEVTQNALLDDDYSLINGLLVITSYILINIGLSLLKQRSQKFEKIMDGVPEIIVEFGKPDKLKLQKARIDEGDILESTRENYGLENMDQIKYAILEKNGAIAIIPYKKDQ